jgi:hypothetical protein
MLYVGCWRGLVRKEKGCGGTLCSTTYPSGNCSFCGTQPSSIAYITLPSRIILACSAVLPFSIWFMDHCLSFKHIFCVMCLVHRSYKGFLLSSRNLRPLFRFPSNGKSGWCMTQLSYVGSSLSLYAVVIFLRPHETIFVLEFISIVIMM